MYIIRNKIILGPPGLPLLGNLLQMNKKVPFMTFVDWAKDYGDIYSFKMGNSV